MRLMGFAAISLALTVVLGFCLLPALKRLQLRQHAYEDAPQSHQRKSGTPTMGGLLFLVPLALFALYTGRQLSEFMAFFFLVLACAAIGFLDDFVSVAQGRNRGIRARTKLLGTALVAVIFLRWLTQSDVPYARDALFYAGNYVLIAPHWVWLLLGIVAITGTIHAVNLTDGLDGLATGTSIFPLAALLTIGFQHRDAAVVFALTGTLGACFGFLYFNRYPAKMFMGDTGSLALGALLSGAAILTGEMLLLILIGGVFVAEALSVIIQVAYFKRTGKRVFRMSPLHHHFELGGWPETKVTARFWLASAICSALGLAIVR